MRQKKDHEVESKNLPNIHQTWWNTIGYGRGVSKIFKKICTIGVSVRPSKNFLQKS